MTPIPLDDCARKSRSVRDGKEETHEYLSLCLCMLAAEDVSLRRFEGWLMHFNRIKFADEE